MSVQKKLPGCIVVACGLCTFQRVWIPESARSVCMIHGWIDASVYLVIRGRHVVYGSIDLHLAVMLRVRLSFYHIIWIICFFSRAGFMALCCTKLSI